MNLRSLLPLLLASSFSVLGVACSQAAEEDATAGENAITSEDAKILDFTFEGDVVAGREADARKAIVSQLMYAQGILTTARNGNGQVGNVKLSDITESATTGNKKKIHYKASLPVAWPRDLAAPTAYDLPLPLDATKFDAFNSKYDGRCGYNEYGVDTFWHDWNPKAAGCSIDNGDVSRSSASIAPHAKETRNKYPEYDLIWEDGRLDVVAIFGIITSDTPGDYGYMEASSFLENAKAGLQDVDTKENESSRSILKDTTITGKARVGGQLRDVKVDVIVVHELKSVSSDFDSRYDTLTQNADMIMYNGHAGLGENVNALARKGKVAANKYQLVLLNGCQTFAYIDTTMTDRRREANGAQVDPDGTKFLDVVGNALPGYANNLASMSNDLYNAVIGADDPKSYNALLQNMPSSHIVVVFGEEDNRFLP